MQRSISISNSNKTALNADAPGCLESGAFVFAVSFTEKSLEEIPGHQLNTLS